jgi:PPP family 3-phenylpropionic acid transporter
MEKQENLRALTLHGMSVEAAYWFGYCSYIAFMVTTLLDFGWTSSQATGAMTAMSALSLLVQPLVGYLSDNFFSEKKLAQLLMLGCTLSMGLLPFALSTGHRIPVLIGMILINITGGQVCGLLDAWIVGLKNEHPSMNYGMLRGTGSLTYALSAQFMGTVTVYLGHGARLWIGGASMLLALVASCFLRGNKRLTKEEGTAQLSGKEAIRLVFSSRQYILLTAVAFCLLLGTTSMTSLLQICIQEFGGSTAQVGTAAAVCAISEVPCMYLMALLIGRFGESKLLVFCSIAYVVRMILTASAGTINGLIGIQLLQGITYAVLTPTAMSYLARIVEPRVRATAVTTYMAITSSVSSILGNFITTLLLAAGLTAQSALVVFSAFALLGMLIAVYGMIRKIW